ncbi:hypothetical protein DL89DRAFT_255852 [Linderina pennispora]|uniref:GIT Spa2 homology (SHD) domain-containing protein n=1 Tax=Linderina pennispora TaxID=61395 RepID=A0A1Y1WF94_9FUNG|nr:uncharacterized protein DL89DRAFT_255852 [Linderina pennispora]ORX72183.1 hypothetical protein DL89DRAFT_255852 [Linderina pennispora]
MESTAGQFSRLMGIFIEQEIRHGVINMSHVEPGKLARLSQLQFQELATDVYDELNRRMNEAHEVPFLPVRDHYHPKRNQARQKLATLSRPKFVDLVQDVNAELRRRFPNQVVSKAQFLCAMCRARLGYGIRLQGALVLFGAPYPPAALTGRLPSSD